MNASEAPDRWTANLLSRFAPLLAQGRMPMLTTFSACAAACLSKVSLLPYVIGWIVFPKKDIVKS